MTISDVVGISILLDADPLARSRPNLENFRGISIIGSVYKSTTGQYASFNMPTTSVKYTTIL